MFFIKEQSYYQSDFKVKLPSEFNKSARAREIYQRCKLDDNDGKTLDDHDQFFRDHKLLLALFRVNLIKINLQINSKLKY